MKAACVLKGFKPGSPRFDTEAAPKASILLTVRSRSLAILQVALEAAGFPLTDEVFIATAERGSMGVCQWFIKRGGPVSVWGGTQAAAGNGDLDMVRRLLQRVMSSNTTGSWWVPGPWLRLLMLELLEGTVSVLLDKGSCCCSPGWRCWRRQKCKWRRQLEAVGGGRSASAPRSGVLTAKVFKGAAYGFNLAMLQQLHRKTAAVSSTAGSSGGSSLLTDVLLEALSSPTS
ncbi:hypothetical protein VOLCADRAFT_87729 [Volvox carteri f. nagariensis]|uniref:Uncharacterized protein n=1 Tax=Volvox carteri f. nagariensis TaxID=3068 RepID=D8TM34_VOLCA|nr:uncharacterized protein VOLCADRAFT_87729 [Volvox carteri f. nagariensis]EFJ51571.1 hypothetical protein VOLCADRAFT_87729 [Volvox carteri f. nagariensis]|eukprot:XP_002947523.1 hypothetical protein VOLCADRAFT_87729 [Volvox carteri f. nagariensis]